MFDKVRFAGPDEVRAYVERSLDEATAPAWHWTRSDGGQRVFHWTVFQGAQPGYGNSFELLADPAGETFTWIHSNKTGGIWQLWHCLRNATVIHRVVLGTVVDQLGEVTLAALLRHLLATTEPNEDSAT